ncbi:hypothetical protein Poli38472_005844 [Pythium oligandrum]|uniref:PX domain-containing protein n=1 Tax=Pythium oligandrum TaxID=41045 RepID=A0A8K1CR99_PYTOL|nr:hypothetical protein Poli38472_005844 [Pythium oligandrum]|eukprot:TMW68376.1 hypothetical protein Poli38472_005844 [Pythium oligandrum]
MEVPTYDCARHQHRVAYEVVLFKQTTSVNGEVSTRRFATKRSYSDFRGLWKLLLRLTSAPSESSKQRPQQRWQYMFHGDTCGCEGRSTSCPFLGLHTVLDETPFPPRKFRRGSDATIETRRKELDNWLTTVHRYFASFSGSLLFSKLRREDCAVLRAYTTFVGAREHFPVQNLHALQRPLALKAWRAKQKEAAEAIPLLEADDIPESAISDEDSDEDEMVILGPDDCHRLPRLDVKPVGVKTMQTFLEDFCTHLLANFAEDIVELQAPELTEARRWEIALFVACRIGHTYGARLILHYYAHANVCMDDETSCLHIAARTGRQDIVFMLLSHAADANKANINGITPLIAACRNGSFEIARMLLNAGADISGCSTRGTRPLHAAIVSNSVEIVELLLKRGADANIPTSSGITPLHFAAKLGSIVMTELLLKHGADPEQQTNSGSDVLEIATIHGHQTICEMIQQDLERKRAPILSSRGLFRKLKLTSTGTTAVRIRSASQRRLRSPSLLPPSSSDTVDRLHTLEPPLLHA